MHAPAHRSWRSRLTLVAGPVALAAAMLIYIGSQSGPASAVLPVYALTIDGRPAQVAPNEPATFRLGDAERAPGARFELVLRPSSPPSNPVIAYAFTLAEGASDPAPLDSDVELMPGGVVRFKGRSRALDGARELRIVLGTAGAIAKFDEAAARAKSGTSDAHVGVLSVRLERP